MLLLITAVSCEIRRSLGGGGGGESVYPNSSADHTNVLAIFLSVTLPESKEVKDSERVLVEILSMGGKSIAKR